MEETKTTKKTKKTTEPTEEAVVTKAPQEATEQPKKPAKPKPTVKDDVSENKTQEVTDNANDQSDKSPAES